MTTWQPIETYKFPWEPDRLLVAAYHKEDRETAVFLCHCADGGLFYPDMDSKVGATGFPIAIDEKGWVAYAWSPDVPPDLPQTKTPRAG